MLAVLLVLLVSSGAARADDELAHFNYAMNCQGCHLPDASGATDRVPNMNNFIGYFLRSAEGRAFVVHVPGVAAAPLPDDQLADLLNWMLLTYSPDQLPDNYKPYTTAEVASLRTEIESDPARTRIAILHDIAQTTPSLAHELANAPESAPGHNDH